MDKNKIASSTSWVAVSPDSGFPIQNLPFGVVLHQGKKVAAIAIGDNVVNLFALAEAGFLNQHDFPASLFQGELNALFALGRTKVGHVRNTVSRLLQADEASLKNHPAVEKILVPLNQVELQMPVRIGNYTDFYASEEHATNLGSMFRDPKNALLPNWKHLPVGYHGRASSIVLSGSPIYRPSGQIKLPDSESPIFSPTQKLDFELELGCIIGKPNERGKPISTRDAEESIIGFVLVNDWSARDIQSWEYVPLGPFLSKNFATTISAWVVTLDALQPFQQEGPAQQPPVLPYLQFSGHHHLNIQLDVSLTPEGQGETRISTSNTKYLYWNFLQMIAHHTVNGCNLQAGDLLASGTISGKTPDSYGSLIELTWNGQRPLSIQGKTRTFLENGDTLTIRGTAQHEHYKLSFGDCVGKIVS